MQSIADHHEVWRDRHAKELRNLQVGFQPKHTIAELSDDLLEHYRGKPLIDHYDVYQHLMDYWAETMQDDCYAIALDGWVAKPYRILQKTKSGSVRDKGWACDLIPKPYIVARYFADEQATIDALETEIETAASAQDELEEEHSGEDGAFSELDKINKGNVSGRLNEIKDDPEFAGDVKILRAWQALYNKQSKLNREKKEAEKQLDTRAYEKYPELSVDEIKSIVIDDKWMASIAKDVQGEMDWISNTLAGRIQELADRYDTPVKTLSQRVVDLESKVNDHLRKMGFEAELAGEA